MFPKTSLLEKCIEDTNSTHTSAYKWVRKRVQCKIMSPYSEKMNDMKDIFSIGIQAKRV